MTITPRLPTYQGAICGCTVSVILILIYGVWGTLQCRSQSYSQPSINIINVPREDSPVSLENKDDNQLSAEMLSNSEMTGQQEQSADFRRIRDSVTGGEETIEVCGYRLKFVLGDLCNKTFHVPSSPYQSESMSNRSRTKKRSIILRRVPRTVVNECCRRSCNKTFLLKYCKVGTSLQSQAEKPPENNVPELVTVTDVPAEEQNTSHQQNPFTPKIEDGNLIHSSPNRSNVITSTLPPIMFPLSSLMKDDKVSIDPVPT